MMSTPLVSLAVIRTLNVSRIAVDPCYRLDGGPGGIEDGDMARITVRLTPRASREEIAGERDGGILVRVTAPPVDGAANEALVRLLAKTLRVPKGSVTIVSGETSRTKLLEVAGVEEAEVRRRLGLTTG